MNSMLKEWPRRVPTNIKANEATKEYVLGYIFSEDMEDVLLIRKERPYWQKGMLNGIGGKIEKEEMPREAIKREMLEEAGIETTDDIWTKCGKIKVVEMKIPHRLVAEVHVYFSVNEDLYERACSMTDEQLTRCKTKDVITGGNKAYLPNVKTMVAYIVNGAAYHFGRLEIWEAAYESDGSSPNR